MIYIAALLYLLGSIMVHTYLEPEDGPDNHHKMMVVFWPIITSLNVAHDVLFGPEQDDDADE